MNIFKNLYYKFFKKKKISIHNLALSQHINKWIRIYDNSNIESSISGLIQIESRQINEIIYVKRNEGELVFIKKYSTSLIAYSYDYQYLDIVYDITHH